MSVLLDSHVLIWWSKGERLGPRTRRLLTAPEEPMFWSAISAWELAIKAASGRLRQTGEVPAELGLQDLAFTAAHARVAADLPRLHGDPFDRALIAQAQVEGLRLITADDQVLRYDLDCLDART